MTTPTFTHVTLLFFLYSDELSRHVKSQPVHFFKYFSFIYWLIMLMLGAWIVIGWGLKGGGCSKSLDISEWLSFFFPFSVLMSVWHQKIYINILYVAWIVWLHSIYFVLSFGWLVLEDWKHVQKKKNPVGYPLMIFLSIYFCLLLIIIGPDGVESDWIGLFRIKAQDRSSVSSHKRNKKCS